MPGVESYAVEYLDQRKGTDAREIVRAWVSVLLERRVDL
jgi:hypothetical protein